MDVIAKPDLWLERLSSSIASIEGADHGKAIHTVRVATRRLDAWLQLAGIAVLRDDLRRLRHGLGKARDIDVLRTREGLSTQVHGWLADEEAEAHEELLRAVHDESVDALLQAFRSLSPPSEADALRRLERIAERVFRAGDPLARSAGVIETLHRLRRRVKLLHYAGEWHGKRLKIFARLQTALGELNDTAVCLQLLGKHPRPDAATQEYKNRCQETLAAQSTLAVQLWADCESTLRKKTERWIST